MNDKEKPKGRHESWTAPESSPDTHGRGERNIDGQMSNGEEQARHADNIKESLKDLPEKTKEKSPTHTVETQIIEAGEATVTVTHYRPMGDTSEDKAPIVFIGGWSTEASTYDGTLVELTRDGREVVFLNPLAERSPRDEERDAMRNMGRDKFMKEAKLPSVELSKAGITKDVLEELGIDNYYLVGHSQGGIVATGVATLSKEHVLGMALVNSAGIARMRPWPLELLVQPLNMLRGANREKKLGRFRKDAVEESRKRIAENRWMYVKEAFGIAATDLLPMLRLLKAKEEHIPTHIFWGQADVGYPGDKMHRRIMGSNRAENKDTGSELYDAADSVSYFSHHDIARGDISGEHSGDLMHRAIMNFPELSKSLNQYFDSLDKQNTD